jgi:hypothetical protein
MKLPILIIIIVLTAAVLSSTATFVYYLIYRNILKKRVASGITRSTQKGRLIAPLRFFIISLIATVFLGFIFLMIVSVNPDPDITFKRLEDNTMIASLSYEGEIGGYERHELKDGDLDVVYYINTGDRESFPAVLVHINSAHEFSTGYTGSKMALDGVGSFDRDCWYVLNADKADGTFTLIVNAGASEVTAEIPLGKNK